MQRIRPTIIPALQLNTIQKRFLNHLQKEKNMKELRLSLTKNSKKVDLKSKDRKQLNTLLKQQKKPKLFLMNRLINECCQAKDMVQAYDLYTQMESLQVGFDISSFNLILNGYIKTNQYHEIDRLYQKLLQDKHQPNIITFHSLFKSCERDFQKIDYYWNEMIRFKVQPDIYTFKIILDQCEHNVTQLEFYWNQMETYKVIPNAFIITSMINGYQFSRNFDKLHNLMDFLKNNKIEPDLILYSTLIQAFGKWNQLQDMEKYYNEMISLNLIPNVITFNSMIHAYGNNQNYLKVQTTYETLIQSVKPTVSTFTTLLVTYRHDLEKLKFFWTEMKKLGVEPNVATYSAMMKGYAYNHDLQNMIFIFEEMKSKQIQPNRVTFSLLIDAYGKQSDTDTMEMIFNEMLTNNIQPDIVTITSMLATYARVGNYSKMESLYQSLGTYKLKPDAVTYSTMITSFGNSKRSLSKTGIEIFSDQTKMEFYFNDLKSSNVKPNLKTYKAMISGYIEHSMSSKIVELFEYMDTKNVKMYSHIFTFSINICIKTEQWDCLDLLYQLLLKYDCIQLESCNEFVRAFALAKKMDKVKQVQQLINNKGLTADT
ncbi:hypothetical protein BC833DRAFT_595570, partial [Globomyces pollinis-pini]